MSTEGERQKETPMERQEQVTFAVQLLWRGQWGDVGEEQATEEGGREELTAWQSRWPGEKVRLVRRTVVEEVSG